ncbi:MAG: CDP-alcohol phosphatidyltransferase family protein [Firmicutes bacterium]|nr:CDP-alcohol phosphatidyltransferase family protein [Bacillota bacterium]
MKRVLDKYKKYIPNILTTLRLAAVPAFWYLTLTGHPVSSTILFGSACATDALDGYLARRWHVESIYGKIVDPFADKSLVMSALLLNGITINPLMLLPFILESAIALVNIKEFTDGIKIRDLFKMSVIKDLVVNKKRGNVSQLGREKTVALMTTVSFGLLNTAIKFPLDKLVNTMIILTSSMEAMTFVEYMDAKIVNKGTSNMRLPDFMNEETIKDEEKENIKELDNNISYTNNKMDREEQINKLLKEKKSLISENDSKTKTRNKKL